MLCVIRFDVDLSDEEPFSNCSCRVQKDAQAGSRVGSFLAKGFFSINVYSLVKRR